VIALVVIVGVVEGHRVDVALKGSCSRAVVVVVVCCLFLLLTAATCYCYVTDR
jgi:hypothetical protein